MSAQQEEGRAKSLLASLWSGNVPKALADPKTKFVQRDYSGRANSTLASRDLKGILRKRQPWSAS